MNTSAQIHDIPTDEIYSSVALYKNLDAYSDKIKIEAIVSTLPKVEELHIVFLAGEPRADLTALFERRDWLMARKTENADYNEIHWSLLYEKGKADAAASASLKYEATFPSGARVYTK